MDTKALDQALAEVIAAESLDPNALRHIKSDMAMDQKATGISLGELPCEPMRLRPILKKVRPARHNLKLSRWSTIKSSLSRLLREVGWVDHDGARSISLEEDWQTAVDCLPAPGQKASFAAFARYCQFAGVPPREVCLQTIMDYGQWRSERTLSLDVTYAVSVTRRLWNQVQGAHVKWPQTIIPMPRDPRQFALCADDFPASFRAEVDDLMLRMATFEPLDPRFIKKYSVFTIENTRNTIFRAATVVAGNVGGAGCVLCLRDVVTPERLRLVMMDHFERVGGGRHWAPSARTTAITLKRVARASGTMSENELDQIARIVTHVKPQSDGLSQRSRERVAQFYDPSVMGALATLPEKLFLEANRLVKAGLSSRAATLHARALQLAILLVNPLRRSNLAELNVERHFIREKAGIITRLLIPFAETKSGKTIESAIPAELGARIDLHLRIHRPILLNGAISPFLWPGGHSGHVAPETIGRNLKSLVEGELGVDFNVHLIRHIVATLLLEENPRNMPLAQQILGHRDGKTTERIYAHARTQGSQKAWGETLERKVTEMSGRRASSGGRLQALVQDTPKLKRIVVAT